MNVFANMGYAIKAMTKLGYDIPEINMVIRRMSISMDKMTEEEAEKICEGFKLSPTRATQSEAHPNRNDSAIIGYAIDSMILTEHSIVEIKSVIREMRMSMDSLTEGEAKDIYDKYMFFPTPDV